MFPGSTTATFSNSTELEENEVIEDTGARAGADAEIVAITNPKETVCPLGAECRNVMKVGDETKFSAYIKNSGDADITEMAYTVNVYLSDANGNPSMIAKDANGNDLSWTNNDVICASVSVCDFQSLAAGAVLGGGKHTMSVAGSPITWTTTKGLYVIEMVVNANPDDDVGNDAKQVFVTVEDWYDIELELAWNSGIEVESGAGTKDWTLTVTADGSDTFDPREVQVRLQSVGDVSAAQDINGNSIDSSTTNLYTAGTLMTVDIFENISTEPATITTDVRNVLSTWTLTGSLTVDTGAANTAYEMKASLVDYTQYGQWSSCVYTDTENVTYDNFCEETVTEDSYSSTDETSIEGFASTFNDIRITQVSVVQGYNDDGTGQGTSFFNDANIGELNVGTSYLHVEVEHRGSEAESTYNWSVDFQITDPDGGVVDVPDSTTCEAVEPAYLQYSPLGIGPGMSMTGYACTMISLTIDGEYTFSASLLNESKMVDAKPSNNEKSMTASVRNNAPLIISLDLLNDEDLYLGQDDLISMAVQVFDVDDPSSSNMEIEWMFNGVALPGCDRATMRTTCSVLIEPQFVTNFPVSVNVYDANGGEVSAELMLQVWNDGSASASTASGMTLEYSMLYWGTSPFSITATDGAAITGETLPGYTGNYDSVGVIDYAPSTTYSANDVLEQSMSVQYAKSLGATSLWYVNGASWTLLSDVSTDVDATTGQFAYIFPANSPILSNGQLVLMGGSLAQATVPSASITGFNAAAAKGGAIQINWDVDGTMLAGDSIDVTVCETVDCVTAFEISLGAGNTSYPYSGQNTAHGVEYTVTVAVCNEVGCSSPVGTGTVVADSAVDGGAAATDLTIAAAGTTWTVSWTASGDQGDVASWKVCYNRGTFTAAQIDEVSCVDATGTSVDIDTSTWSAGTYTYHFTAVPVDALGNSFAAGAMNSIDYQRYGDTDNDGVKDNVDAFPYDASETMDDDMDGIGNNADVFPYDASETMDSDMDGVGNNADVFPYDAFETMDSDMDGVGDNADAFPQDATETIDSDMDGVGDNSDVFPQDATESLDSDNDSVGDNADAFPNDATETLDTDGDGTGDNAQLIAETLAAEQAAEDDAAQKQMMTIIAVVVLLIGGAAGAVLFMRKRGNDDDDGVSKDFTQQAMPTQVQPVQQSYQQPVVQQPSESISTSTISDSVVTNDVHHHYHQPVVQQPVQQTYQQPVVQQSVAVAEPTVLQEWTDEAGYTWRAMDDGTNFWWTGTEWQKHS